MGSIDKKPIGWTNCEQCGKHCFCIDLALCFDCCLARSEKKEEVTNGKA